MWKCVGAATISSPIAEAWSNTYPNSDSSRPTSNAVAPRRPISSLVVKSSSQPTGEPPQPNRRATSSSTATAALLSAPRIASRRFVNRPSVSTTSMRSVSGTVSRWAQSITVRAPSGAAMRASRLPQPARVSAAVSSSSTSRPTPSSSARTARAISSSLPEGLSISQSRTNVSTRRCFSAPVAGTTPADTALVSAPGPARIPTRALAPPAPQWRRVPRARRSRARARARARRRRTPGT
jgi:hypothetical protein